MKYRIIECKKSNGDIYYKVQKKLFFWEDYKFDHQYYVKLWYINSVENVSLEFKDFKFAEKALKHSFDIKEYKNQKLYPCILEYGQKLGYYCLWKSKKYEYGVDYRIIGTEEECKNIIDELTEQKENLEYKKIVKEIYEKWMV